MSLHYCSDYTLCRTLVLQRVHALETRDRDFAKSSSFVAVPGLRSGSDASEGIVRGDRSAHLLAARTSVVNDSSARAVGTWFSYVKCPYASRRTQTGWLELFLRSGTFPRHAGVLLLTNLVSAIIGNSQNRLLHWC